MSRQLRLIKAIDQRRRYGLPSPATLRPAMKILLGVDDGASTHHLFQCLATRPAWLKPSNEYTALHVLAPLPNGLAALLDSKEIDARQADAARQVLAALGHALDHLPGHATRSYAIGDPGTVLARRAAEGGFDLVMIGSHEHTSITHWVTGSTVSRLLAHATTPVVVMR
jgi:nucleotide-binding universal stress UspA family protein